MEAIIRMKNNMQKSDRKFTDLVNDEMFLEICEYTTGQRNYSLILDEEGYNKGRLLTVEYGEEISYVTLSGDDAISGRNSFVQSMPTTLVTYINDNRAEGNKSVYYYFIETIGNINTNYLNFMYRLAVTAGITFINDVPKLGESVEPFTTIPDLLNARVLNRRNQNNSTYVTRNEDGQIEIYGKTYGANKKETTLICLAISSITPENVTLYQVTEGDLSTLPRLDLEAIEIKGNIDIVVTNETLEREHFYENESLRSPVFTYNLFNLRGEKKCTLCDCRIPEIIEGAHIWPVAEIKKEEIPLKEKINYATDGENGLWLCKNHHKLLDAKILIIKRDGTISTIYEQNNEENNEENKNFIYNSMNETTLDENIVTEDFLEYHSKRYQHHQNA